MVDPVTRALILHRGLYLVIAGALLFVRILPLHTQAGGWPGPDLLLALTLAWVLRRPEYVPALIVAGVFLMEDFLLWRPPGLWAAIVLGATEILRRREASLRDMPFAVEWALVAALLAGMLLADRFALGLFMVPQAGLGQSILQGLSTALAYPVVVWLMGRTSTLRKAAPGETDEMGRLR